MRFSIAVALMLSSAACHTWRVGPVPAQSSETGVARVTLRNGTQVQLHKAVPRGDSLYGFARIRRGFQTDSAVAVRDVELFESRRLDPVRTAGLLAAVAIPLTVLIVATDSCFVVC